jgi:hypothetical protein
MLSHDEQGARDANAAEIQAARARAAAAAVSDSTYALVTAGDVGQPSPEPIGATATVILIQTKTPKLSGRFRMHAHYRVTSDGMATHTVTPQLAYKLHTDPGYTILQTGETMNVPAVAGVVTTDSIDADHQGPPANVHPPVAYDFALILTADAPGLTIALAGAQLEVQELID